MLGFKTGRFLEFLTKIDPLTSLQKPIFGKIWNDKSELYFCHIMLMISSRLNDKIMQLGAFEWVILVKNVFFRHFPIVFYRKYSKIKRTVFRTCCPRFQGLICCTEPCLDTLEAWWKGQNGPLSFSLNSFSANDSRVCASDRNGEFRIDYQYWQPSI